MKPISFFLAYLLLTLASANGNAYPKNKKSSQLFVSQYENVLGTSLELKIAAGSRPEASKAEEVVLSEISRLSSILSAYDAGSEFSRWFRTSNQPVRISSELLEVMQLFDYWQQRTHGALNPAAETINRLWKQAANKQELPTPKELDDAVEKASQQHWSLDVKAGTATHTDNVPLAFNSFVKSYIIKRAADAAFKSTGVHSLVVNIGGDMVIEGEMEERVSVTDPRANAENEPAMYVLKISNRAVATSGNYRRGESINGHWYSHIVDPRNGIPSDEIINATVVAPNATDAGALATAFNVMTVAESKALAASLPGVEYLIITKTGERVTSNGWNNLVAPQSISSTKNKLSSGWSNDYEMLINLEINTQKEGFVKRPYVAVWVEDEDHAPVRTIALWHGSDRYLNELKSWFLKYRSRYYADRNFNNSVTGATRSAGKYTIKWDGKDDQGNDVKPGKYIVKIEVSREHGTYQLMRQEIVCDETPKMLNMTGNVEISSASIDYRKKANGN